MKKNQNLVNDANKSEHKSLNSEVEGLKNQIIIYQSNLGTQDSKLSYLEKEVAIFRTPSWNCNNSNDFIEIKSAGKKSKQDSNTSLTEVQYPDSTRNFPIVDGKMEESLNFMICVSLVNLDETI